MRNPITMIDFNCDWFLKDHHLTPRPTSGDMDREEIIRFLGTLDVDAIELMHDYWKDLPAESVRRIADDAGMPIFCYIFVLDLAVPPAERAQAIEDIKGILDRITDLGAPMGMIVPGLVKENYQLDEQRTWMIEGLCRCAELADNSHITLVAENIDFAPARPLMGLAADCLAICDAVDSPAFRLIFDAGACVVSHEDPVAALRTMAPRISHVHAKNNRRVNPAEPAERFLESEQGSRLAGCNLDEGEVDLSPLLAELARSGYEGSIAIEYQGEQDPRETLPHNVRFLRNLMEHVIDNPE